MDSVDNAWPFFGFRGQNATEYGSYLIEEIRQLIQFTTGKDCYKGAKHTQRAWVVQELLLTRSVFMSIGISSIGSIEKDLLAKSSRIKCQRT
jgi:pantothenate synthetase